MWRSNKNFTKSLLSRSKLLLKIVMLDMVTDLLDTTESMEGMGTHMVMVARDIVMQVV